MNGLIHWKHNSNTFLLSWTSVRHHCERTAISPRMRWDPGSPSMWRNSGNSGIQGIQYSTWGSFIQLALLFNTAQWANSLYFLASWLPDISLVTLDWTRHSLFFRHTCLSGLVHQLVISRLDIFLKIIPFIYRQCYAISCNYRSAIDWILVDLSYVNFRLSLVFIDE